MPNIKFSYLYRDAGNYKTFSSIILSNSEDVSLIDFETLIRANLIDDTWFYADKWKVPALYFNTWDRELDHAFHEFESISFTNEPANANISLNDFIEAVQTASV